MINFVEFKEILRVMLRTEIEGNDEKITVPIEGKEFILTSDYFLELTEKLEDCNTDDETLIHNNNYFEVLTRGESRFSSMFRTIEAFIKEDESNKIIYEYISCSDKYLIFILNKIYEAGLTNEFRRMFRNPNFIVAKIVEGLEDDNLLSLIKVMFPRFETVRVSSEDSKSKSEYEKLCNSFLFQIGFNLNYAIVEIRFLDEFFNPNRLMRLRRLSLEEMEAPKRKYTSDLVYHYQMALSAESPMLQFLSYYHVMEHFFEKIYNEELIKIIEKEITKPSFSSKREKDIKVLINIVSKKIKDRGNSYTFNEKEALMLTLSRYVSLEDVKSDLNEFDEKLVSYYRENEVKFSKGDKVNLNNEEIKTFNQLANRIYKTRNAIVHSKEGEKSKFKPFIDDKFIINEIPLMRFLAEKIIIEDSTLV